ncbi:MAG: TlpA disulfide reductase family protein [Ginsengibacter sp.]
MNIRKKLKWLKEKWLTILFYGLLAIFIFSPDAKSWLLRQVVSTGLLKADIKKVDANKNIPAIAPFSISDSEGKIITTGDLKGKVVFINFWASWCPPCRAEMPSLNELYLKLKDDDRFVFLFMNEDDDKAKAVRYIEDNQLAIPFLYPIDQVPVEIFSGTLPTTVVLDKKGKVVLKHSGMAKFDTDDFIRQLKELSSENSSL